MLLNINVILVEVQSCIREPEGHDDRYGRDDGNDVIERPRTNQEQEDLRSRSQGCLATS